MSRIYWDTMLFVYWLEDHPVNAKRIQHILTRMKEREDELFTSAFTLGEVLVGVYKQQAVGIARQIQEMFRSPSVSVLPFTIETAERYAAIRATSSVSPADAIHLACAAEAHIDLFLTNDADLVGKAIPGIQFIAGIDTNLF